MNFKANYYFVFIIFYHGAKVRNLAIMGSAYRSMNREKGLGVKLAMLNFNDKRLPPVNYENDFG